MRTRTSQDSTPSRPAQQHAGAVSSVHDLGNQEIQRARRGAPVDATMRDRVSQVTGATLADVVTTR
jgi:hypothetical protein